MEMSNFIRNCFPSLKEDLVYFDSASTTLKPKQVIEKIVEYYSEYPVNIHRAIYPLAERASLAFETAREIIRAFINARYLEEIVVTKGTTESINLISYSWGEKNIKEGDTILVSTLEHHSNILPWIKLAERKKANVEFIPINSKGEIDLNKFQALLNDDVKLLAITYVSNVIGTQSPLETIIKMARNYKMCVVVDAAQAVSHLSVNVQSLDCDFLCFSGHKLYGPTGVGILYGKKEILKKMPPYLYGGGMVSRVHHKSISYAPIPHKFEAGTPPIAEFIGLGAAVEFIQSLGFEKLKAHEDNLLKHLKIKLMEIPTIQLIGNPDNQIGVCSIIMKGAHAHDLGTLLAVDGISVRAGHHCAYPIMDFYKVPATLRISLGIYNTIQEIDKLFLSLQRSKELFECH